MAGRENMAMSEVDLSDKPNTADSDKPNTADSDKPNTADSDKPNTELSERQNTDLEEVDIGFKDLTTHGSPPNVYVGKRNFIHQLMDVALLMANVSQLKALLSIDTSDDYYIPLFVFICMSIVLQVVFTISMLAIWSIEKKLEEHSSENPHKVYPNDHRKKTLAERLDKMGNILVLLVIVSNVFITGLGVEPHGISGASTPGGGGPQPLNHDTISNKTLQ